MIVRRRHVVWVGERAYCYTRGNGCLIVIETKVARGLPKPQLFRVAGERSVLHDEKLDKLARMLNKALEDFLEQEKMKVSQLQMLLLDEGIFIVRNQCDENNISESELEKLRKEGKAVDHDSLNSTELNKLLDFETPNGQ